MWIKTREEGLPCTANITFWPRETADILNYPQRQRATQKWNNLGLHLQAQVELRSTLFNLMFNIQLENGSDKGHGLINAQAHHQASQNGLAFATKCKTKLKVMLLST